MHRLVRDWLTEPDVKSTIVDNTEEGRAARRTPYGSTDVKVWIGASQVAWNLTYVEGAIVVAVSPERALSGRDGIISTPPLFQCVSIH